MDLKFAEAEARSGSEVSTEETRRAGAFVVKWLVRSLGIYPRRCPGLMKTEPVSSGVTWEEEVVASRFPVVSRG